ncbi:hypothetical protein PHJA_002769000 [Phtheirospermum japonicum]|uniref:Cystatin domain-containing protein n=1 Tax=Phtheirospermum japonicum TaxID=374723 RepID=A0A830D4N8_9LAMI|nr:hypothetical protein PHJA_002769000 [Phtheirospermum japonicum]
MAEQNKQPNATKLEFVSIIKGERQVVVGFLYRLVIIATFGGNKSTKPDYYLATLYESSEKVLELISFKKIISRTENYEIVILLILQVKHTFSTNIPNFYLQFNHLKIFRSSLLI